jgi:predicted lipoprotein with Yx(FWY)xxD motif
MSIRRYTKTVLVLVLGVAAVVYMATSVGGGTPAAARTAEAAATPATLTARSTRFGSVLFAGNGRVLYAFTRDRRGLPSRCYGDCAVAWPVFFANGTPKAGAGVKQSLLGVTRRRDGRRQVTYNGWPLYFYAHESPGEIRCQDVFLHGGTWFVVNPSGRLVR